MRVLLTNARIADGTGAPVREGEVLVEDGVIAEVGGATLAPDETLDVGGLVVAPGFIDIHSHSDFTLPAEPLAEAKVCQGITTEVVGNCGLGLTPANERVEQMYARYAPLFFGESSETCSPTLADYRQRLHRGGISVNAAVLVPHGNVRCAVLGLEERTPTATELDTMRELVGTAMEQGAFGLSTGLVYPPGSFSDTEEVIALARVAGAYGGIYATHMRDEGPKLVEAVAEALRIGEEAGLPVQLSHHKAAGKPFWGKVQRTLGMVDEARRRGLDVHSDVYPYTAGSSVLAAMVLPPWAFEGSHQELLARMQDPAVRARMIADVRRRLERMIELPWWLRFIPRRWIVPWVLRNASDTVVVSSVKRQHHLEGRTVRDIMKERGKGLFDTLLDLLVEEDVAVVAIAHVMCESDVRRVMAHEATMIGTDGFPMRDGKPHPRTYGSFPRVLARYVREEKLLGFEDAIHRMTGMSAHKLGLTDRGVVAPGKAADLVVLDPAGVQDQATYEDPRRPPLGIPHVMVGGVWTVRDGVHTGARAGRVLARAGSRSTARSGEALADAGTSVRG